MTKKANNKRIGKFLNLQSRQKKVFDFLIEYQSGVYGSAGKTITTEMVNNFMIKVVKTDHLIQELESYFQFKEEMFLDKGGCEEVEDIIDMVLSPNNNY